MLLLYSFESKGLMSCETPLFSHPHGLLIRLKRYLEQEIFLESFCFRRQTSKKKKQSVFLLRQCHSTLKGLSSSVIVTELSLEYFPLRLSRLLHNKTAFYPKKHWICFFDGPSPFLPELFFRRIHETELVWVPYSRKSTCGNLSNNYVEQICLQTHSLSGCQTPKDMSETSFCVLGIDFGECLLKI